MLGVTVILFHLVSCSTHLLIVPYTAHHNRQPRSGVEQVGGVYIADEPLIEARRSELQRDSVHGVYNDAPCAYSTYVNRQMAGTTKAGEAYLFMMLNGLNADAGILSLSKLRAVYRLASGACLA